MTEQTETLPEFIDVTEYRHDHGHRAWAWRCWGADVCDGWLSLDHSSEGSATRSALRHLADDHPETGAPMPEPTPETVHASPRKGSGVMPCCGRTPFEVPRSDRISIDPFEVTCGQPTPAPTPVPAPAPLQACRASISGRCLAVTQGDPGCATTDGECVHA